jgi:hypothetical protein
MSNFRSQQGKTFIRMDILPPETDKGRVIHLARRRGEIVDAQFVPVDERPRGARKPTSHNDNRRESRFSGGWMRRSATRLESKLKNIPADFFTAMVAALFVTIFSLAGGFSFLSADAREAKTGPVLDITHVTMTPQDADGMRVLLINGIVENLRSDRQEMPSIRADLLSGDVVVATTLINVPQVQIEGRQSRGFAARVPHPGGKLPDLRLSFAERSASRS